MHAREKLGGVCGSPVQKSCEKVHRIQESLKSASITERTKFLACGTDLRTYRSEHHLECSRPYNRCKSNQLTTMASSWKSTLMIYYISLLFVSNILSDLSLTHFGRCVEFDDICPEKLKYIQTATPICGTDGHSYISFEALLCARYRMNKSKPFLNEQWLIWPGFQFSMNLYCLRMEPIIVTTFNLIPQILIIFIREAAFDIVHCKYWMSPSISHR